LEKFTKAPSIIAGALRCVKRFVSERAGEPRAFTIRGDFKMFPLQLREQSITFVDEISEFQEIPKTADIGQEREGGIPGKT